MSDNKQIIKNSTVALGVAVGGLLVNKKQRDTMLAKHSLAFLVGICGELDAKAADTCTKDFQSMAVDKRDDFGVVSGVIELAMYMHAGNKADVIEDLQGEISELELNPKVCLNAAEGMAEIFVTGDVKRILSKWSNPARDKEAIAQQYQSAGYPAMAQICRLG